ncbi:uncharacterized protein LOC114852764 isoform X2 [Betta splendens]|nr:uncharacterized protein LOC114852764 isoform X2 [Betta splendens]
MSVELHPASGLGGNDAGTTVGGSKPLHRLLRAQPKTIGITVLILGASFAIITISLHVRTSSFGFTVIPRGILVGSLSFISGILFIVTEHKPSKKTVAASLALSIMTILSIVWSLVLMVPDFVHRHIFTRYYDYYDWNDFNFTETGGTDWYSHTYAMGVAVEVVFTCYSVAAAVVFIVMSVLGAAALRSSRTQTVVVMTAAPTDTPAE